MSSSLLAAGLLLFAVGLVHSGLGEFLFIRHIEKYLWFSSIPGSDDFLQRTFRLPWRVTWHFPSILGWAFALILTRFAYLPDPGGWSGSSSRRSPSLYWCAPSLCSPEPGGIQVGQRCSRLRFFPGWGRPVRDCVSSLLDVSLAGEREACEREHGR
jgi:hypothetical protein